MGARIPSMRDVIVSSFRFTVALLALSLLLCIAAGGLVAIVAQPYLMAAFWLLGMVGLMACASAYLSAFPGQQQSRQVPHPLRAVACLSLAGGLGGALWSQAAPAMVNEPLGMGVASMAMRWIALLGCVILILLPLLALVETEAEEEEGESVARGDARVLST